MICNPKLLNVLNDYHSGRFLLACHTNFCRKLWASVWNNQKVIFDFFSRLSAETCRIILAQIFTPPPEHVLRAEPGYRVRELLDVKDAPEFLVIVVPRISSCFLVHNKRYRKNTETV